MCSSDLGGAVPVASGRRRFRSRGLERGQGVVHQGPGRAAAGPDVERQFRLGGGVETAGLEDQDVLVAFVTAEEGRTAVTAEAAQQDVPAVGRSPEYPGLSLREVKATAGMTALMLAPVPVDFRQSLQ